MTAATQRVIDQYQRYVMNTYVRQPLVLTKAKGTRVWDVEGHEYLDLFPGWGVSGLGYNHPWVMRALRGQTTRIIHVANNYYQPLQWQAAKKLVDLTVKDGKVFFTNSGAEAVEGAIKLVRRWGHEHGGRSEIICFKQSFHGRTLGALSATGQDKYQQGFGPLVPGFAHATFNNLESVEQAITPKTCAVLVEPIQGEGGVHVATEVFLQGVRQLCHQHRLLLVMDEIQSGMGRTGAWFGYQHYGLEPDVVLLAKTVGGGFPVGALIAKTAVAEHLPPGTHGATYGGNPLACACILAVCEVIVKEKLLDRVQQLGPLIMRRLAALKVQVPVIKEVRGKGLMVGIELTVDGRPVVERCREKRLLINCTQERILRLLPAMTITQAQLDKALGILEGVLSETHG